ncbi:Uncharacterized protein ALO57_00161 [Pseudomonas coronafaciens pv. oryzae]|nr:hypothetical protein [Pseudomonas coronafaciens]KPY06272.1 Uncharacterized protein ALO57_00161 [Pseudomonas coronafaciens pv. oryzae]RMT01674.1 hypothetical protein ALP55_03199 [Pseudomonas coronafaciens pv. oryzae]
MAKAKSSQKPFVIAAVVGFFIFIVLGMYLLQSEKFTGTEFTAFIIAFALLSTMIAFAPQVQEISVAGSVLKLREVKAEAEEVISSLEEARSELLGMMLTMLIKPAGGFHDGQAVDPRLEPFWQCVSMMKRYKCLDKHKPQLIKALSVLLIQQIKRVFAHGQVENSLMPSGFIKPHDLSIFVVRYSSLDTMAVDGVVINYSEEVEAGIAAYEKLYNMNLELV